VQALWFRALLIAVSCLGILALYRLRLHRITHQLQVRFEERLAERTRIAQELHDTLLQGCISAYMQLHLLADAQSEDSLAKGSLDHIVQLVGRVIEEGRNALRGLRIADPGTEDLGQAFARVPEDIGVEQETRFRIRVEGQARALRSLLRDEIYRIGREALLNAFRHSRAKNVEMELEYGPKSFRFLVRDDGCGMDQTILTAGRDGHWGLRGMRERSERIGGNLHVWSKAMTGTEVEFSVPNHVVFGRENRDLWPRRIIRLVRMKRKTGPVLTRGR
jgi:signal transduction histidine kinase